MHSVDELHELVSIFMNTGAEFVPDLRRMQSDALLQREQLADRRRNRVEVLAGHIGADVSTVPFRTLDIEDFKTVMGKQKDKRLQTVGADMLVINRVELVLRQHV